VELMAHFDDVLPGRIHRVEYERLIESPESEIRRLLAYLDLPFEESCLRFYENDPNVQTVSGGQVPAPIHKDSLESWRRYEEWLEPLRAALGPVLGAYPEVPAFPHRETQTHGSDPRRDRHLWSELQLSRHPQVLQPGMS